MRDERDFEDLSNVELSALYQVREWIDSRKPLSDFWIEIRKDEDKYKIWEDEKDRLAFKVAKQELKNEVVSTIRRLIDTPWYNLPWYEKIFIGPMVLGLKGINWCLQKMTKVIR